MLALIFFLAAAALFLDVFLPAALAIIPVAFLLIGIITCTALLALHRWGHRE